MNRSRTSLVNQLVMNLTCPFNQTLSFTYGLCSDVSSAFSSLFKVIQSQDCDVPHHKLLILIMLRTSILFLALLAMSE